MKWLIIILIFTSCNVVKKQPVASKEVIKLDGSKSYDPDGYIVSYLWRQVSGPTVLIEDKKAPVTYGNFNSKGVYKFELTVIDNMGASDKDTATVHKK